ncbi:Anaphase-promoting complex subunit 7 [Hondaea fermentalgiana]|uniref:Anaphase-promoting complex subunit 7 n=1 Tax=Hondaea fermentalgiana TaxID=2315210 RepID=A0A2R5FYI6_9STRA|nr:Anaphase-promoting complex subunit 7 [Hondaea fermentalgiana]|eukprot:GBG23822.1 Anaphase-promoting complex subunit 7 [Hondaea fermentalgiana]
MPKTQADEIGNLQAQVAELLADEVLDSAALLGTVMLSRSAKLRARLPQVGVGSHLESVLLFADVLKRQGENKRAIEFYNQALTLRENLRGCPSTPASSLLSETSKRSVAALPASLAGSKENDFSRSQRGLDLDMLEAHIRFSIARCLSALDMSQAAIRMLESIDAKHRTASMLLWMGKLYESSGMDRPTVSSYREALRSQPYALRAATSLLRLGVNANDVWQVCQGQVAAADQAWLHRFVDAHGLMSLNQYGPALQQFHKLSQEVPNNSHVLTNMAYINLQTDDLDDALTHFRSARRADPTSMENMDVYARAIYEVGDETRLNSLTRELMDIDEKHPAPWLAVALFCDTKGDSMSALKFLGKALELDHHHVASYQFKGLLHLRMSQPELGVSAFYKSYSIRRDYFAYQGLVHAYMSIPKLSDALRTAKEALQLMPKNPRAIVLVGRVLAQTSGDGPKKAKKAYLKALKLDPKCHEAAIALADLNIEEEKHNFMSELKPAVEILQEALRHSRREELHVKLGDVFVMNGRYPQALHHYNAALSLNSNCYSAKEGLERIESEMPPRDEWDQSFGPEYAMGDQVL